MTALAVAFAVTGGLFGLYASSRWNVAAGAAIALTVTAMLVLSSSVRWAVTAAQPRPAGSGPVARTPANPG
jgi:ABC-type Mn2+/Zn2+ transport system permease subunit